MTLRSDIAFAYGAIFTERDMLLNDGHTFSITFGAVFAFTESLNGRGRWFFPVALVNRFSFLFVKSTAPASSGDVRCRDKNDPRKAKPCAGARPSLLQHNLSIGLYVNPGKEFVVRLVENELL